MKYTLQFLLCTLCAFSLYGNPSIAYADNVPGSRYITDLYVYEGLAVAIYDPPYNNDLGCAGKAANRSVAIRTDYDRNMYELALKAYIYTEYVGFGIYGCDTSNGGIPIAYRIDIHW